MFIFNINAYWLCIIPITNTNLYLNNINKFEYVS